MRILVTGATGLLGNNIVRQLVDEEHKVRVLVRASSDRRPLEGFPVEIIEAELGAERPLADAIRNVDQVIHSAALVHIGWKKLAESRRANVEGTRALAKAALIAGIRFLHVSTVDTLGVSGDETPLDEDSPPGEKVPCSYVVSKTEAEQAVHELIEEGLDASIVHPGFMLGPWDWKPSSGRMLLEVAKRWTPIAPTGGGCVADVRDVASGVIKAMQSGQTGRHYILGGENISYFELWKIMADVAHSGKPFMPLGPMLRGLASLSTNAWTAISGKEGDVNSAAIKMGTQFHYYSSQRAKEELGYQTRPPRESVEDAWNWFVANGYATERKAG